MALFVDGPASDAGDLARLDGGLLETAAALSIDVTTKLQIAHETLAADLQIWLDRIGGIAMEQVVVNDALRTWESTQALAMVYREAYFSDLAERYHVRWDEYSRLTRQAYERFVAGGLPTVSDPIRKATPPVLGIINGPQAGGSFYASIAWVNAAGKEGEASDASSLDVPDGRIMTIQATMKPSNAVGFHVFGGTDLNKLTRRNEVPLPPGASFLYIPGSSASGPLRGRGQTPESNRPLQRTRG